MSQNDPPYGNNMVPGGPDASIAPTPQGGYYPQDYPVTPPSAKPSIDTVESSRMTPQILVLLVLAGIKRNWKWALPAGLVLGAIAFAALYLLFPIRYEAKAWIRILTNRPYFIRSEGEHRAYESLVQTQFATIRSPLVLEKALESPDVARLKTVVEQKNKPLWLMNNLRLNQQGRSELITISIETPFREEPDKIVNAVLTAYFENYEMENSSWNDQMIRQLNMELTRQQAVVRRLQEDIQMSSRSAAGEGAGAGEKGFVPGFNPGESIQRDVYINESKLFALTAELEMMEESADDPERTIPRSIIEQAVLADPNGRALAAEKAMLQASLESLRKQIARPTDPRITDLEKQIERVDRDLATHREQIQVEKEMEIRRGMAAGMEEAIWQKQMEVRSQQIYVENLRTRLSEQLSKSTSVAEKITDIDFKQEQLRRINGIVDILQNRVVTMQTEMNAPAQIKLLKKASTPGGAQTAKQIPMAAMGAFCCFAFPLFLGIAIERIKPRLYHVSQIRRAIPDVIIGEIMEPPVAWIHGATFRKRLARYRESVHNWCTHLLLSDPFRRCRTLSVASVSGDDGKTFLAVQVAVAMAQMKSGPVLLIDGDMRVGRLHLLFGNEETGIGLADVLSFRNGFGEAVVLNEREPNLHLLSSGQLDVSPYELLGDGRFRELLETLETHYSLILVVLPPVANAAESLVMASSTDSVLLCVRQGETILAAMEDVFRKLVNTGSSVDGIVVKDIPYYQMAGKDGGFADKVEQVRLAHLLQYAD